MRASSDAPWLSTGGDSAAPFTALDGESAAVAGASGVDISTAIGSLPGTSSAGSMRATSDALWLSRGGYAGAPVAVLDGGTAAIAGASGVDISTAIGSLPGELALGSEYAASDIGGRGDDVCQWDAKRPCSSVTTFARCCGATRRAPTPPPIAPARITASISTNGDV